MLKTAVLKQFCYIQTLVRWSRLERPVTHIPVGDTSQAGPHAEIHCGDLEIQSPRHCLAEVTVLHCDSINSILFRIKCEISNAVPLWLYVSDFHKCGPILKTLLELRTEFFFFRVTTQFQYVENSEQVVDGLRNRWSAVQ